MTGKPDDDQPTGPWVWVTAQDARQVQIDMATTDAQLDRERDDALTDWGTDLDKEASPSSLGRFAMKEQPGRAPKPGGTTPTPPRVSCPRTTWRKRAPGLFLDLILALVLAACYGAWRYF